MRAVLLTVAQLAGVVLVVVAGYAQDLELGIAATGAAVFLVAAALDREAP